MCRRMHRRKKLQLQGANALRASQVLLCLLCSGLPEDLGRSAAGSGLELWTVRHRTPHGMGKERDTPFFTLSDEVGQLILERLGLEDLCVFGRASRCCWHLVSTADGAWSALYQKLYGAPSAQPVGRGWREALREQHERSSGERCLKLAATAMKLHSQTQKLRQQQHSECEELAAATKRQQQLQAGIDSLLRAR